MSKLEPLTCTKCGKKFLFEECHKCCYYTDNDCECTPCYEKRKDVDIESRFSVCGEEIEVKDPFVFR
jgi:hypothetical protein